MLVTYLSLVKVLYIMFGILIGILRDIKGYIVKRLNLKVS